MAPSRTGRRGPSRADAADHLRRGRRRGAHERRDGRRARCSSASEVGLRAVRVHKEIPGFLWNRVWFAMLREMLHLVDIGAVDAVELDSMVRTTLRAFVPVFGPLQMTDLIGHDTLRDISNALYPELATDRTASTTIEQHVARRPARRQERAGLLRRQRRSGSPSSPASCTRSPAGSLRSERLNARVVQRSPGTARPSRSG